MRCNSAPAGTLEQRKINGSKINLKSVKVRGFSSFSCLLLLIFFVCLLATFCWFSFHFFSLFYIELQILCIGQLILKSFYMFTLIIIWLFFLPIFLLAAEMPQQRILFCSVKSIVCYNSRFKDHFLNDIENSSREERWYLDDYFKDLIFYSYSKHKARLFN